MRCIVICGCTATAVLVFILNFGLWKVTMRAFDTTRELEDRGYYGVVGLEWFIVEMVVLYMVLDRVLYAMEEKQD